MSATPIKFSGSFLNTELLREFSAKPNRQRGTRIPNLLWLEILTANRATQTLSTSQTATEFRPPRPEHLAELALEIVAREKCLGCQMPDVMEEYINETMIIILSRVPSAGLMFFGYGMEKVPKNDTVRVANSNYYAAIAEGGIMARFRLRSLPTMSRKVRGTNGRPREKLVGRLGGNPLFPLTKKAENAFTIYGKTLEELEFMLFQEREHW
ncbi:7717_t:CDS:2, partial [Racocetra persica]